MAHNLGFAAFLRSGLKPSLVAFFDSRDPNSRGKNVVQKMSRAIIHARKISKYADEFESGAVDVANHPTLPGHLGVSTESLPRIVMVHKDMVRSEALLCLSVATLSSFPHCA